MEGTTSVFCNNIYYDVGYTFAGTRFIVEEQTFRNTHGPHVRDRKSVIVNVFALPSLSVLF